MLKFFQAMRYEYVVRTLQQQQKCINLLKIVSCEDHKFQKFVNIFFKNVQNYQIKPYM